MRVAVADTDGTVAAVDLPVDDVDAYRCSTAIEAMTEQLSIVSWYREM